MTVSLREKYTIKNIIFYAVGMLIAALGVCLIARANVGISPVTSFAYLITVITKLSLGTTQFIWNIALIVIQIILTRKEYEKIQLLQLATSILFSLFIDLWMPLTAQWDYTFLSIFGRSILFAIGMVICAFGLSAMAASDLLLLPGDGVARVVAKKLNWPFGRGKIVIDCACVALTIIVSFVVLHRLESVKAGTVIAALVIGNIVRLFMRWFGKFYARFTGKVMY